MHFFRSFLRVVPFIMILSASGVFAQPDSDDFDGWYDYGLYLVDEGDNLEAIDAFKKALKFKPKNSEVRLELANAYSYNEDWANCSKTFDKLLKSKPNDFGLLSKYLRAVENSGKSDLILSLLKKLFNQNKNDVVLNMKYLRTIEGVGVDAHKADYRALLTHMAAQPGADPGLKQKLAGLGKGGGAAESKAKEEAAAKAELEKMEKEEAAVRAKEEAAQAKKDEEERKRAEAEEAKEQAAQEKAERESQAKADKEEKDRLAKEAAEEKAAQAKADKADKAAQAKADKEEKERLAKEAAEEKAAQAKAEKEEKAAQAKADKEEKARLAKEAAEEKAAQAKAEKEEKAAQAKADKEEKARLAKEAAEEKKREREEKAAQAKADREEKAREKAERDAEAKEQARIAKEEAKEQARIAKEEAKQAADEAAEAKRQAEEEARIAKQEREQRAKEEADEKARVAAERQKKAKAEKNFNKAIIGIVKGENLSLDTLSVLQEIYERLLDNPNQRGMLEAQGILYYYKQDYIEAKDALERSKSKKPMVRKLRALSHYELGEYRTALQLFKLIKIAKLDKSEWKKYIDALEKEDRRKSAATQYGFFLKKYPDDEKALSFLMNYYRDPMNKKKLIPVLEKFSKANPTNSDVLLELSQLLGKKSSKGAEYRKKYLSMNKDSDVELEQAAFYESQGKKKEAVEIYLRHASSKEGDVTFNKKLARLLEGLGKHKDAISYYDVVARFESDKVKWPLKLAKLYKLTNNDKRALEAYSNALDLSPADKTIQNEYMALAKKGSKSDLKIVYEKIVGGDSKAHKAQYELGMIYLDKGDKSRAYSNLSRAITNQPSNPKYGEAFVALIENDDDIKKHFTLLKRVGQKPGADPKVIKNLARGFVLNKDKTSALKYYQKVFSSKRSLLEEDKNAIQAFFNSKKYSTVIPLAETFLKKADGQDGDVWEMLVKSYEGTGERGAKYSKALKKMAQIDPNAKGLGLKLARQELRNGDTINAIRTGKKWLEDHPNDLKANRFLMPLVKNEPSEKYTYANILERMARLDKKKAMIYKRDLGIMRYKEGQLGPARDLLIVAAKAFPKDAELWNTLGKIESDRAYRGNGKKEFLKAHQLERSNQKYARDLVNSLESDKELKVNLNLLKQVNRNKPKLKERVKLAKSLYLNGKYGQSADLWIELIKVDPKFSDREPMATKAILKAGRTEEALPLIQRQAKKNPKDLKVLEQMASLHKKKGNQSEYIATMEKIVKIEPAHKNYQLLLAKEKQKMGKKGQAVIYYDSWIARNPKDKKALQAMYQLTKEMKDSTRMLQTLGLMYKIKSVDSKYKFEYGEMLYKRQKDISVLKTLVKSNPKYKKGRVMLILARHDEGNVKSIVGYEAFMKKEVEEDSRLLEPLADVYAEKKKSGSANSNYLKLLQRNRKDRRIYDKVYAYAKKTKFARISEILRIGEKSFDADVDIKFARAKSLGKNNEALKLYKEVVESQPSNLEAVKGGANAALATRKNKDAEFFLNKWVELDAKNKKPLQKLITLHTADGNLGKKAKALEKLIYISDGNKKLSLQLAEVYKKDKKANRALEVYKKLLDKSPSDGQIQKLYIDLASASGATSKIEQAYLEVVKKDPKAHKSHFELAKLYIKSKRKNKAYDHLQKALQVQPKNPKYTALLPQTITEDKQIDKHFPQLKAAADRPGAGKDIILLVARGYLIKNEKSSAGKYFAKVHQTDKNALKGNRKAILALASSGNLGVASKLADDFLKSNPRDKEILEIQVTSLDKFKADKKKLRKAMTELTKLDKDNNKWWLKLARLDLAARDTSAAIKNGKTWVNKNREDKAGYKFLMPLIKKRPAHKSAYIKVLEKMIKIDRTKAAVYRKDLGILYAEDRQPQKAKSNLEAASKAFPKDPEVWFTLGKVKAATGDKEKGRTELKKAYQLKSHDMKYAKELAKVLESDKDIKGNLSLLQKIGRGKPSISEKVKLAKSLYFNKEYKASAKIWKELLKVDSKFATKEPTVADALMKAGMSKDALPILEAKSNKNPRDLKLLEQLAKNYKKLGQKEKYLNALKNIVKVEPGYKDYQLSLAKELMSRNQKGQAILQYDNWIARNTSNKKGLLEYYQLVRSAKDTARLLQALGLLYKIKSVDTKYKYEYGQLLFKRKGDPKVLETLVRKYPKETKLKKILVMSYFDKGQYAKYSSYFKFIQAASKTNKKLLGPLAEIYVKKKQIGSANAAYFGYLQHNRKDRKIFDKVYAFSKKNKSKHMRGVLKIGVEDFPSDQKIKLAYAGSLGNNSQSLKYYNEALKSDPNNLEAVKGAAKSAVASKKTAEAVKHLDKWSRLEPQNQKPLKSLVKIHTATASHSKLSKVLEKLVPLTKNDRKLTLQLARVYEKDGKKNKAADLYKKILNNNPKDKTAQNALLKIGGTQKSTHAFIVGKDSNAHVSQFELAKIALKEKNKPLAYKHLRKALKVQPGNKKYRLLLPKVVEKKEQVLRHFQTLQKLAAVPGADVLTKFIVAMGHNFKKNKVAASKGFMQVYRMKPSMLKGQKDPILVLYGTKNYRVAGELADSYLKKNPNDKEVWEVQARCYEIGGADKRKLRKAYQNITKLNPDTKKWWLKLARLDLAMRDTTKAIANGKKWIRANPKSLKGYNFLLPLVEGKAAQAKTTEQILTKLVKLDRKNTNKYSLRLGKSKYKEGKYSEAETLLSKVSLASPRNAEVWYLLGKIEERSGRKGAGRKEFSKAYSLAPPKTKVEYARSFGKALYKDSELKLNLKLFQYLNGHKPKIEEKVKLAKALYLNNNYKASANIWGELVKKDPNFGKKEPMAARAFLKSGMHHKAIPIYEDQLKKNRKSLKIQDTLALLYKKAGDKKGYSKTIESIVKQDPGYKKYQLILGKDKLAKKDTGRAIQQLEQWVNRHPNDKKTLLTLYDLTEAKRDTSRMLQNLRMMKKLKGIPQSYSNKMAEIRFAKFGDIEALKSLIKRKPNYKEGRVVLIKHYYKKNEIKKIMPFERFMVKESRNFPDLHAPLAEVLVAKKKNTLAGNSYYRALVNDPKNKKLYHKVLAFVIKTKSPHKKKVLEIGYKNFPEDSETKAQYAQTLGNTSKALKVYEEILGKNSNSVGALSNGASVAMALKKYNKAVTWYTKWSSLKPKEKKPLKGLVKAYEKKKDKAQQVKAMEKLAKLTPNNASLHYDIAKIHQQRKNNNKAVSYLKDAVNLKGKNKKYRKELGLLLVDQKKFSEAKGHLEKADGKPGKGKRKRKTKPDAELDYGLYKVYQSEGNSKLARAKLVGIARKNPSDTLYIYPFARLESNLKNHPGVIKALEHPVIKRKLTSEMSFLLLKEYTLAKKPRKAAAWGSKLIKKYPAKAKQSLELAILFYDQKKYKDAVQILDHLERTKPTPEISFYRGKIAFKDKDWNRAVKSFEKSKSKENDSYKYLGFSYNKLKKKRKALKAYETFYNKTQNKAALPKMLALYKELKDNAGAFDLLERLVKAYPRDTDYKIELAKLYLDRGFDQKAVTQFRGIIKKKPTHGKANIYLGIEDIKKKKYKTGIKRLRLGLKKEPKHADGWKYLGDAYLAKKNNTLALSAYNKAYKFNSKSLPIAVAKMKIIKKLNRKKDLEKAYQDVVGLDANHKEASTALAHITYERKQFKRAEVLYKNVTRHTKNNRQIWENYGNTLLANKKVGQAKVALQKAVRLGAKGTEIKMSLASIQIESGQLVDAEKNIRDVISKKKTYHRGYFLLAQIANKRGQEGIAEDYLVKAVRYDKSNAQYAGMLGDIRYRKGEYRKAIIVWKRVRDNLGPEMRIKYATALAETGKFDLALAEFQMVTKQSPSATVTAKMAELYIMRNQSGKALQIVRNSKYSDDPAVQFIKAKAMVQMGKVKEGQQLAQRLIKRDKKNPDLYFIDGLGYYRAGNYKKAKTQFKKALSYKADYTEALFYIGLVQLNTKKIKEAKDIFQQLKLNRNKKWKAKGYIGLAKVFEREGKPTAVAHHLEEAVALDESVEVMYLLTKAYVKLRKSTDATKWANKAYAKDSNNKMSVMARAEIFVTQKKLKEAHRMVQGLMKDNPRDCEVLMSFVKVNMARGFDKPVKSNSKYATKVCPEDPMPYFYLGMVAHKVFDKKNAKKHFKKYKKLGGPSSSLPKAYK